MKIEEAMKYAGLWRAGKLIGGDEDDVRDTLLGEVDRLQPENAELRQELETWWEMAHDEGCTNMKDCASYGGTKECYRPRPEILKRPNGPHEGRAALRPVRSMRLLGIGRKHEKDSLDAGEHAPDTARPV